MLIEKLGFRVLRMAEDGGTPSPAKDVTPSPATPTPATPSPATPTPSPATPTPTPTTEGTPTPASPTPSPESTWPADWRTKGMVEAGISPDDVKAKGLLDRYTSPGDIIKKMMEQEKLIRSGELKKPLTKDSKPEEVAAYRKENNIPETPDKYDLTLDDGLVIGEADKPIVTGILKAMHEQNISNDTAKKVLSAYYSQEKAFLTQFEGIKADYGKKQDEALRASWGKEYTVNENGFNNYLNTFSEETRSILADANDSNGMPLMKNAAFKRDMLLQARIINPQDIVVNPSGTSNMSSVQDEIAAIKKEMSDPKSQYWKGDLVDGKNTKMQSRILELNRWVDAQTKK